ncbi:MAG: Hsp20/alpha crystallin family protein [Tepidisphaeraceae bacterium]
MLPVVRTSRSNDPFDMLHREFDTALNRLFGNSDSPVAWAPYAVDVREDGDHLYVEAELPGFSKDEIDLTMENQTLTISAERREQQNGQKGGYLLNERRYSRFLRSFTLPPTVDDKKVDAKLDNGILTVVLNKREETKPKKIAVS